MNQESFDDYPRWRVEILSLLRGPDLASASTNNVRMARMVAALRWLEAHASEIARKSPTAVMLGDGEAQIEESVIRGLYGMFSRCPESHLHEDFPVSTIYPYLGTK
jgi:hypothetical protein